MDNQLLLEQIKSILLKKAEGYFYDEKVQEFQQVSGEDASEPVQLSMELASPAKPTRKRAPRRKNMELIKEKVSTHYLPPDLLAIKLLIELSSSPEQATDLSSLSEKELLAMRDELVEKLKKL